MKTVIIKTYETKGVIFWKGMKVEGDIEGEVFKIKADTNKANLLANEDIEIPLEYISTTKLKTSYIVAPMDLFVKCPHCDEIANDYITPKDQVVKCPHCNKSFQAIFDKEYVVNF